MPDRLRPSIQRHSSRRRFGKPAGALVDSFDKLSWKALASTPVCQFGIFELARLISNPLKDMTLIGRGQIGTAIATSSPMNKHFEDSTEGATAK
jgi:hypothetical protein